MKKAMAECSSWMEAAILVLFCIYWICIRAEILAKLKEVDSVNLHRDAMQCAINFFWCPQLLSLHFVLNKKSR